MEKYQKKYRIPSARLQGYDYGSAGMYFITICTANREYYFGEIVGDMQLSEIGKIAQNEWYKTLEIRPDMNLQLDAFIVMPNHIHGIIVIGENEYNGGIDGLDDDVDVGRDAMHRVSTSSSTPKPIEYKNTFTSQSKNLASIIRGYKSSVTKQVRVLGFDFNWQSRFYEHIIRNENSFKQIQNYIINNPQNWIGDKFNENKIIVQDNG